MLLYGDQRALVRKRTASKLETRPPACFLMFTGCMSQLWCVDVLLSWPGALNTADTCSEQVAALSCARFIFVNLDDG